MRGIEPLASGVDRVGRRDHHRRQAHRAVPAMTVINQILSAPHVEVRFVLSVEPQESREPIFRRVVIAQQPLDLACPGVLSQCLDHADVARAQAAESLVVEKIAVNDQARRLKRVEETSEILPCKNCEPPGEDRSPRRRRIASSCGRPRDLRCIRAREDFLIKSIDFHGFSRVSPQCVLSELTLFPPPSSAHSVCRHLVKQASRSAAQR